MSEHSSERTSEHRIWVDADACPKALKEILFKASKRTGIALILVANQPIPIPRSTTIKAIQVAQGFDVADNYIVQHCSADDLVITGDIPLAAELIALGAQALNPRGELYTEENIRQRLNMRDFMDTLRGSGINTGGPPALNQTDRRNFANQLDQYLARHHQSSS